MLGRGMGVVAKHAIVLASKEWCEAAASGRIRVYDFRKPRKFGARALGPGSVCVVLTKARQGQPPVLYGEFRVVEVKLVDAYEYNRLVSQGLIYSPQVLKPGEKRWIIVFDEFKEYREKVPKNRLTDVRTSTSKKPISEWVIIGLSYIDDRALEGIRRKAGGFIPPRTTPPNEIGERIKRLEERVAFIEKLLGIESLAPPLSHECAEFMLLSKYR